MHESGLMRDIDRYFKVGVRQLIFNLNRYVRSRKKKPYADILSPKYIDERRRLAKSKSPIRFRDARRHASVDLAKPRRRQHSYDSSNREAISIRSRDSSPTMHIEKHSDRSSESQDEDANSFDELEYDDYDEIYHFQKQSRNSLKSLNAEPNEMIRNKKEKDPEIIKKLMMRNAFIKEDLFDMITLLPSPLVPTFKYFSDLTLCNSIIYYATSEGNSNGILFTPRQYDLDSDLFARVFFTFIQSSFKLKNLLNDTFQQVN
jgi:hypothetical protein